MLKVTLHTSTFDALKADITIVLVVGKNLKHHWIDSGFLETFGFECKAPFLDQNNRVLYIPLDTLDAESMREAGALAVRTLNAYPFKKAKIGIYEDSMDKPTFMPAFILGALLGEYCFDTFKSKKQSKSLSELCISSESYTTKTLQNTTALQVEIDMIKILSESINLVRDLINTPPQIATPKYLASQSEKVAKKVGLKCKILKKQDLKKEKMGAYLAVARASNKAPRLIHLSYKPKEKSTTTLPKIVLVGKGLTYDSGGLSLKPSDYMTTMKADKSGGCAVLGIMNAIAQLKLQVEVEGIIGASENMIGGNAYKPDDVLFSREGKTIEVRNTDAEGRLVLCDCLSYAQDLKPDILIDFATLTGACVVGLGEYTSGIMGYNEALKCAFEKSALDSGELVARLPFNRHIRKLIESKIADVCNISSSRYGGAISAGMFLGEFIREEYKDKWLHIDIAGPAFVEREWDINPYGASGAGVRAGVQFIVDFLATTKKPKKDSKRR